MGGDVRGVGAAVRWLGRQRGCQSGSSRAVATKASSLTHSVVTFLEFDIGLLISSPPPSPRRIVEPSRPQGPTAVQA